MQVQDRSNNCDLRKEVINNSSATRGNYLLAVVALRGRQTTRVAVALQQEPGWWLLAVAARGCVCWLLVSC